MQVHDWLDIEPHEQGALLIVWTGAKDRNLQVVVRREHLPQLVLAIGAAYGVTIACPE